MIAPTVARWRLVAASELLALAMRAIRSVQGVQAHDPHRKFAIHVGRQLRLVSQKVYDGSWDTDLTEAWLHAGRLTIAKLEEN